MNPPTELIDDLRLLEAPVPWRIPYGIIAAALLLFALTWWVLRALHARRLAAAQVNALDQAHANALAELEKLFALIDTEQSRPYGIESSAIIRRYIETRFHLEAPKQSTEEFLAKARRSPKLTDDFRALLAAFLEICDLLKFARTLARRDELVKLHDTAVRFVKETAPELERKTAA